MRCAPVNLKEEPEVLVLTRTEKQVLYIGDNITITVLQARDGRVKLGIDAPPEIPVHRQEAVRKEPRHARQDPQND